MVRGGSSGDRSAFGDAATLQSLGARPSCRAFVYVLTATLSVPSHARRRSTAQNTRGRCQRAASLVSGHDSCFGGPRGGKIRAFADPSHSGSCFGGLKFVLWRTGDSASRSRFSCFDGPISESEPTDSDRCAQSAERAVFGVSVTTVGAASRRLSLAFSGFSGSLSTIR